MSRLVLALIGVVALPLAVMADEPKPRPNILWITCEDISPNLGCYGDKDAVTPNLDRFATQAVRYTHAFTVAGVCAPSRSCLITGMYPTSLGTHHMRCTATLPNAVKPFPEYLRQAGYYCSNNAKEDYNFKTAKSTWDESSGKAHWRKRGKDQPFFSVFNLLVTHESQIRAPDATFAKQTARLKDEERHDPAKVTVPPFHPDTPVVRRDWARYHDLITAMDKQAGDLLKQLADDGLSDDTIVFFFSDHGVGLPRGKRWLYDTGLRVPLLIRFPEKYQHLAPGKPDSTSDLLVSFVDFGPSILSVAGIDVPKLMQGVPFLGKEKGKPREYVFGHRDRMDERYDFSRAVRDRRYKYIRNYLPHLPYSQPLEYMDEMPTMKEWRRLAAEGKLEGPAALFMQPTKPIEELYDTESDPHEIRNLAGSAEHRTILGRLRRAQVEWQGETADLGLMPEAEMHIRANGDPFLTMSMNMPVTLFVLPALKWDFAAFASADKDSAVRYWAVVGVGLQGVKLSEDRKQRVLEGLRKSLTDPSPVVRVAAADSLCRLDQHADALPVLIEGLKHDNEWVRLAAVNVLDRLGDKARPALPQIKAAVKDSNPYVVRVVHHALKELDK